MSILGKGIPRSVAVAVSMASWTFDFMLMIAALAAFVSGLFVPSCIAAFAPESWLVWLARHPWWATVILAWPALGFIWFSVRVAHHLEGWCKRHHLFLDALPVAAAAVMSVAIYTVSMRRFVAHLDSLQFSSTEMTNANLAVQGWVALWLILLSYIGKVPWDHARSVLKGE